MNNKAFNQMLIICGSLCIYLAISLYIYSSFTIEKSTEEFNEGKEFSVADLKTLQNLYQNIEVGDSASGEGGDSFKSLSKIIGEPDTKTESYSSENQSISFTWHESFKWQDPLTFLVIEVIDGKIVSKSLGITGKDNEVKKDFIKTFEILKMGDLYTVDQLIKKLGYPTQQSVFQLASGQSYTTLSWGTSNKTYTIYLTNQEISYKSMSSY